MSKFGSARPNGARAVMERRKRALASSVAVLATLESGCYSYRPSFNVAPAAGEHVAFEITDQGRVGLAEQLGPGVTRIEGLVAQKDSTAYVINVSEISTISGGAAHWTGERVNVPQNYVARVEERAFSPSRTFLAVGAAAAAITVFIVTHSLLGGGNAPRMPDGPPGQGS